MIKGSLLREFHALDHDAIEQNRIMSHLSVEHDLSGKPISTFPDHCSSRAATLYQPRPPARQRPTPLTAIPIRNG
jgi:hypothetical protein